MMSSIAASPAQDAIINLIGNSSVGFIVSPFSNSFSSSSSCHREAAVATGSFGWSDIPCLGDLDDCRLSFLDDSTTSTSLPIRFTPYRKAQCDNESRSSSSSSSSTNNIVTQCADPCEGLKDKRSNSISSLVSSSQNLVSIKRTCSSSQRSTTTMDAIDNHNRNNSNVAAVVDSSLLETSERSITSTASTPPRKIKKQFVRKVSFGPLLEIRTHNVIVGDHPLCQGGMAIQCDWGLAEDESAWVDLDLFEQGSLKRRANELRMSYEERRSRLQDATGKTASELLREELILRHTANQQQQNHLNKEYTVSVRPMLTKSPRQISLCNGALGFGLQ